MDDRLRDFLARIAKIESNGGQNTNHKMITHGLQVGTAAIGKYGLMPNTIKEIVDNKIKTGQASPEFKALANLDPNGMKTVLEHKPELQDQLAESYAKSIMLRKMGDPDKMAYSWYNGPNSHPTSQQLNNSDYVRKFRNLASVVDSKNQTSDIPTPRDVVESPDFNDETMFKNAQDIPEDEMDELNKQEDLNNEENYEKEIEKDQEDESNDEDQNDSEELD